MKSIRGIIYALISSATFGLIPLFSIPLLRSGMTEPSILFYRMGLAALIVGIVALFQNKRFSVSRESILRILIFGTLYAATSLGLLMSYNFLPSGISTTVHFLYPILVTAIMVVVFRERKSVALIVTAIMSLLGVAMLSWSDSTEVNITGLALVLGTVVTYAVYIVGLNQSKISKLDTLLLTFYVLCVGTVIFALYATFTTGIQPLDSFDVGMNAFLLALLPTVVSNFTLILAVKHVGSTVTAILGSLEPVTAVIVGIMYFHETFNLKYAMGLGLIIVSVSIVVWNNSRLQEMARRGGEQPDIPEK